MSGAGPFLRMAACASAIAIAVGVASARHSPGAVADAVARQTSQTTATREQAYRANNIGVARLEQFDFGAAAISFREALSADPGLAIARLNLGIALLYGGDADGARREIEAARPNLPERPQPDYLLGLIARAADRTDDAIEAFTRVQKLDPSDVGTAINLGQLHLQARNYPAAIDVLRRAVEAEPYNATAAYAMATALVRSGAADEGRKAMEHFQQLRESSYATTFSQNYLEQGRYAEAIASTGAETALVDPRVPEVVFADASSTLPARTRPQASRGDGGAVTLFDMDADGDLDLAEASGAGVQLYRNEAGRFRDVQAGLPAATASAAANAVLAGDYDNDGDTDLVILRPSGLTLVRRDSPSAFTDVTKAAGLDGVSGSQRTAAWLDADHDGDLDLLSAAEASGIRLLRNNGDGRFTDVTATAAIAVPRPVVALVPTDYDNRRDIDLLLVSASGSPFLFRNLRDGSFRDVAAEVGLRLDGSAAMAAVADLNKDGFPDVFIARRDGPGLLAESDGRGRFTVAASPPEAADARAAQFLDYDNDGLLDLLLITARGPRVLRNLGRGWSDVSARAVPAALAASAADASSLATGDVDGDGDTDLVVRGASGLAVWRNDGGSRSPSLRVALQARVSNRSAAGAKIEMRAGSLRQRQETAIAVPAPAPADVIFGFGDRAGADAVRVLWPSGILQAETRTPSTPLAGRLPIEELDRKPSSCPYLYTWNGERFEFVTDFLGGGEIGYWLGPGLRNTPDSDEYVRIEGSRLRARDGRYELRITNELEEALFLDRVQLVAVAHPADVEVHPNEGLGAEPAPFRLYAARGPQPPLAASDDHGHDVLDLVSRLDRRYPGDFEIEPIRGYAADHALELTLPPPGDSGRRLLLLTGWTDYAFSGDNVAAHQAGLRLVPPSLEVKDANGRWRTAIEQIGFPVGRPQTVVVDLTDRVPASARDIRIRTTMRVYWDRALVDTSDGNAGHTEARLDPLSAALRWRGFSAAIAPDGREPFAYDYDRVSPFSPWKLMPGRYTREGDVLELLVNTDDMFVVSRPGDEIALSFDAASLPGLPAGWTRTFLLYSDGFSKEMNLHSSSPDGLLPLPFHAMTRYPYAAPEAYPSTPAHLEYLMRYNTRVVPRAVPSLDLALDRAR